ncbi:hypothetical protein M409DRAFT_27955 [Zasmidium cellare ATCC 36951]|uniref:Anaphase-promoting complex subunit 11 n=1 Tax=Zasmidium cellare ATCC 36951 TaxID=1080233 RepID=A0A6A6C349_ZASCE|nr:uncharacterized protein M409DRAFT_27955 [Zasmidium cellare ATCC 36951]KAF2161557.1 hypothetical protein M409DRAFT_27955 [Zasmidium cellare ATCC 36951]
MATELRRSTRQRKQPQSYAEDQAEAQLAPRPKPKSIGKKRIKTEVEDDETFEDVQVKTELDDAEDVNGVTLLNAAVKAEADSEDEAFGRSKKKQKRTTTSKKSRKSKKSELDDGSQLYGNPPEGTIIPWGSKTRKQPRIYEVPEKFKEPREKKGDAWLNDAGDAAVARELAKIPQLEPGEEEYRLRDYEDELPEWYERFFDSAAKQKMCVLERSRGVEQSCHAHHDDCPCETLKIAGSKGNVYTVYISHLTLCNCPVGVFAGKNKKQCKHVLYVLHHILKAPEHLAYQAAFLHTELKELSANAPPLPTETIKEESKDGNRKEVTGECPICFMDFEDNDAVLWCRAACGNNIHKDCFNQWASMKAKVTCPFCRSEWQHEDKPTQQKTTLTKVTDLGGRDRGGYVNVADQIEGYD